MCVPDNIPFLGKIWQTALSLIGVLVSSLLVKTERSWLLSTALYTIFLCLIHNQLNVHVQYIAVMINQFINTTLSDIALLLCIN